jgi:peptide/nickel transport system ATP-binding protein
MLGDVRLDASYLRQVPRQLSGGERQRIAIARALAASPAVLLCDEILSSLDVSVQAGVRDLLQALQAEHGMTYLFISHDLAVVRSLAHSVGVLFRGQLCEIGRIGEVYAPPYHPYTGALLAAVPDLDRRAVVDPQRRSAPVPAGGEPACPFAVKCPWKIGPICEEQSPPWREVSPTHRLRCHYALPDLLRLETVAARAPAEAGSGAVAGTQEQEGATSPPWEGR